MLSRKKKGRLVPTVTEPCPNRARTVLVTDFLRCGEVAQTFFTPFLSPLRDRCVLVVNGPDTVSATVMPYTLPPFQDRIHTSNSR